MPVARIERTVGGSVTGRVEHGSDGLVACHDFGSIVTPTRLATIDEVADFLQSRSRGVVRMNPGWSRITTDIDGVRLR